MPPVAKALFRPQNPALRYSPQCPSPVRLSSVHVRPGIISRRLKQTSALVNEVGYQIVEKYPRASFYRTKRDLRPYSCAWKEFSDWRFFCIHPQWHDLTDMEFFIKRLCKVPGTIRPLAFLPLPDACIAFAADGKYFYLDTCKDFLERFGGRFASDDEFLEAFTRRPRITGKVFRFPDDTDRLYWAVWDEQEQRKQAAAAQELGRG
ncbi:hypothetical protein K438DRAFT_2024108 [Mycena galopus ATCC 62051]|nr:hypothetical protein K438DRAFT_2024108 [Mycena galopus ATCC 62051]